jgi:hypothetical protein
MAIHKIETPRGVIVKTGKFSAELKWNPGFENHWGGNFNKAQKIVDSEVLRNSEPYTPLRTSMLVKSGTLGTVIGSGEVAWIAPYARRQYYLRRPVGSETGPLRGSRWFDRMKVDRLQDILKAAKKEFRG